MADDFNTIKKAKDLQVGERIQEILQEPPDVINWTSRVSSIVNNWQCIEWSPKLGFYSAVVSSGRVITSPDVINWTVRVKKLIPEMEGSNNE